jgi:hypothetical protein
VLLQAGSRIAKSVLLQAGSMMPNSIVCCRLDLSHNDLGNEGLALCARYGRRVYACVVCVRARMYVCVCVRVWCACVRACACVCVYVYACVVRVSAPFQKGARGEGRREGGKGEVSE